MLLSADVYYLCLVRQYGTIEARIPFVLYEKELALEQEGFLSFKKVLDMLINYS